MSGPGLLNPWGLLALASLAVVGVIYLFYQRYRKRSITALFLWEAPKGYHEGGRKISVIRLSRSLLLDLLACLLLALAVAAPAWIGRTGRTAVIEAMQQVVADAGPVTVDYISIIDPATMQPVEAIKQPVLVALAVRVGSTRLIDNLQVDPQARRD